MAFREKSTKIDVVCVALNFCLEDKHCIASDALTFLKSSLKDLQLRLGWDHSSEDVPQSATIICKTSLQVLII